MDRFPSTLLLPMLISSLLALSAPVRATAEPPGGSVTAPAAAAESPPAPPVAARRPHALTAHGQTRDDPYYWLRDDSRTDPEVLGYLEAENRYTEARLAPVAGLRARLRDELAARLQPNDDSVPYLDGGYWYGTRFLAGQEHPLFVRRADADGATEEVVLDGNLLAAGHDFFQLAAVEVSHDQRLVAWAEDTVSRRQYTIRVREIATGRELPDRIENTSGEIAWAADGKTFFYVERDPQTLLPFRVRRHTLGTDAAADPAIYEERDPAFHTGVATSRSRRWVFIQSDSTLTTEVRFAPAAEPTAPFRIFLPREAGHEYEIEDLGDRFFVRSNWRAPNFRLLEAPLATHADRATWREIVPHRDDVFLHGFLAFRDYLALAERGEGLRRIRIRPLGEGEERLLATDQPAYVLLFGANPTPETQILRYTETSLVSPATTYDLDMATGERQLRKREPVLGGFDPERYASERLWITARDGERVPVSLVYRKGFERNGTAPLLQYGYGAYGFAMDPYFNANVISLLDRGFVYAIAHVRGGQELGRRWYDGGRLQRKKQTFFDFIDVTEALVAGRYCDPQRVFALGGSAGGLLIGAVANLRPDLYRGMVAAVPFVDVVTTMLDESIPLTTGEFEEWGNPKERAAYDYMLSYSPYDQVRKVTYPNLLVTTGLWDSQVQYWEPAKWVAKLRATAPAGDRMLLLHTNMQAGHGGKSGRFARLDEIALEYAFFLDLAGIRE
jgi:oligopeptidase B